MITFIGLASIFIAFGALIYCAYKGLSVMYIAPVCAIFVAAVHGINPVTAITGPFVGGATGFIGALFPIFLLSILMGRIYIDSGAAGNIARVLMKTFAGKASGEKKQTIAVYICIAVSWIMCYGGIDTFCALFTLFPVILTICKEAGIPRKYLVGLITCGVSTAALTPGAPLVTNYIPMGILGTSPYSGLIPGLAAVAIMLGGGGIYLTKSIHKAVAAGETFDYGPLPVPMERDENLYPNFWKSLIPLITVILLFNILNNLIIALSIGFIVALLLMYKNILPENSLSRGKTVINSLNIGGRTTAESLFLGGIIVGLATVIQATPTYQGIVDGTLGLNMPPALLILIAVTILVGLTGSPPAGLQIVVPVLSASLAISPEALHRIATTSATTFDTLPFQGAIIIMLNMAGLKHKEGYFPVFMCTVVWTITASLVVALLYILFPSL